MPRIVRWLHDRSVAFYATHDIRQLGLQPWAEYAIAHIHCLYGGDRLDNLIQWFSMLGSVIGVSLVALELGASWRGQILAALLCATIPEGVLVSSTVKNDYVLSFWLVAMCYYLLAFRHDRSIGNIVGIGIAAGLACLTKGTAFFFAPPVMVCLVLLWVWRDKVGWNSRGLVVASLVALCLNAGFFYRNYSLFHSPFGTSVYEEAPPRGFKLANAAITVPLVVSNVIRNAALHIGTAHPQINNGAEKAIKTVLADWGINPNDPRNTLEGTEFHINPEALHEAVAGNPIHWTLMLVVLLILLLHRRDPAIRPAAALAIGASIAFVLFCAVLKWQPWHTRLHLPLFVLWTAVTGTVLGRFWTRSATAALGVVLSLAIVPNILGNTGRPLVFPSTASIANEPRAALYFNDRPGLIDPYAAAARFAKNQSCDDIGLNVTMDGYEYPLLVFLGDETGQRNVVYVGVKNASKIYASHDEAAPCLVICPDCSLNMPNWRGYADRFASERRFGNVAVLSTKPTNDQAGCSVSFGNGWHGLEKNGPDWWRWSSGTGDIQIFVPEEGDVVLTGEISSIRFPNTVDVVFGGEKKSKVQILSGDPTPFQGVSLHLNKGDNLVRFISHNPGTSIPTDARVMAAALRNLQVQTPGGCQVQ